MEMRVAEQKPGHNVEQKHEMTVLVLDQEGESIVPSSHYVHVLDNPDMAVAESAHNVFVLSTESQLGRVSDFVRAANRRNQLRALLIREENDSRWIAQILDRAAVRTLRNTHIHSGRQVPQRVLNAWAVGAQDDLIANATVREGDLLVLSCSMQLLRFPFAKIPVLSRLPSDEQARFHISPDGSYIHWPASDVDVDLEGLRTALDPALKARADQQRLIHDQYFGRAIAVVRHKAGLRQSDISGLSERHLRRIEAGESTSADILELLARAHNMDANKYMNLLADVITEAKWESARPRSRSAKQAVNGG